MITYIQIPASKLQVLHEDDSKTGNKRDLNEHATITPTLPEIYLYERPTVTPILLKRDP